MEIYPIEQYVRENVSDFKLVQKRHKFRSFDLYDKADQFCGAYIYTPTNRIYSDYFGKRISMSILNIFDENFNKVMQKIVCQKKDNVEIKDHTVDSVPVKLIPQTITTLTTFFDFVNDKFKTVERKSVLQNDLVRIGKDDKDFYYNENHAIYEELKDKPVYKQDVRLRREGSISEVKNQEHVNLMDKSKDFLGFPYIFW